MRVLQVTHRYPPNVGGVETHVHELAERLSARGHDVSVVAADAPVEGEGEGDVHETDGGGVPVARHRGCAPGGAFHVAPGVLRSVLSSDADVVHAHNYHSLPAAFAAAAAGDATLVVTPHYHGRSASRLRDRLLALYRPVGRRLLARADAVVAVSQWERDRLADRFDVDATVVPNGLDLARFAGVTPLETDRPYLLAVGRLVDYKGVRNLVHALQGLPEYDLLVAGTGPYRSTLEGCAELAGVRDRTTFLGYVDDAALPALYAGASVFVSLSELEAYGVTVAEALASGTPCVVSDTTALSEWAERADCVGVDHTDPPSVARAVRAAADLSAPSAPLPDWEDTVDGVLSVYERASHTA
ncbi:glycosyltransferase family 4 protein [Halomarina ordinaria]|uniref:Glycosyltransferase family 4 protein n=1 Tax=Halomarina ordinaria TaxID=3033939 RepID=A0ABD5UJC2_9EURY|nr:glycosyltransferase family 4 protein [Halomarina sp. PSRA2]